MSADLLSYLDNQRLTLQCTSRLPAAQSLLQLAGNTALLAANLVYEMLCVLPGVSYRAAGGG